MTGRRNKNWIGVATKIIGRIADFFVDEGDFVVEAQLRQAQSAETTARFRKTLESLA
jgi:hypothetical protein